jgi:hypothetical protein
VANAPLPATGIAQIAETTHGSFRLIVRRTRLTGAQAELFPDWRHHCFATNRQVPMLTADIDHRDHATIELTIRSYHPVIRSGCWRTELSCCRPLRFARC